MAEAAPRPAPGEPGKVMSEAADVERQVERSAIRTQMLFNRSFERLSELEVLLLGLIDVLVEGGVVGEAALPPAARRVEGELAARAEGSDHLVALRDDSAADARPVAVVDCAARIHVCKAVCCRLAVTLSGPEVEAGKLRWDLGRPYRLRRDADGQCAHLARETATCGVYDDRPRPCRQYTCATDARIWSDFESMELNHAWLDAHLKTDEPELIEVQPLRVPPAT